MKINDVEKLTGLTAKSIRLYEAKGLIAVKHDPENGYRIYSEEDVSRLKRIKLLRYLDFSMEDIRRLQDLPLPEVRRILQERAEQFDTQIEACQLKRSLCISLSRDYDAENSTVEEYDEAVKFLQGEEFAALQENIKDITCPSLPQMLLWTLALSAPVIGLFANIRMHSARQDVLALCGVLSLLGTVLLTLQWRTYFDKRRYQKARMRENGKRTAWVVLALIPVLAAVFGVFFLIDRLITLFAPAGWLFYEFQGGGELLLLLITEPPLLGAAVYMLERLRRVPEEKSSDPAVIFGFLWRYKWIAAAVWCALFYLAIVNVTFVTPDRIVAHSTLHPAGVSYAYSDIDRVETDFGRKTVAVRAYERKGTFSYRVIIGDKTLIFSQPSVNEDIQRYVNDSYLELEEFDGRVMASGAEKAGSAEYSDRCDMDRVYIDRFLRIIENT